MLSMLSMLVLIHMAIHEARISTLLPVLSSRQSVISVWYLEVCLVGRLDLSRWEVWPWKVGGYATAQMQDHHS